MPAIHPDGHHPVHHRTTAGAPLCRSIRPNDGGLPSVGHPGPSVPPAHLLSSHTPPRSQPLPLPPPKTSPEHPSREGVQSQPSDKTSGPLSRPRDTAAEALRLPRLAPNRSTGVWACAEPGSEKTSASPSCVCCFHKDKRGPSGLIQPFLVGQEGQRHCPNDPRASGPRLLFQLHHRRQRVGG